MKKENKKMPFWYLNMCLRTKNKLEDLQKIDLSFCTPQDDFYITIQKKIIKEKENLKKINETLKKENLTMEQVQILHSTILKENKNVE